MKQQNLLDKSASSNSTNAVRRMKRSTSPRLKLIGITLLSITLLSLSTVALSGCTPTSDTPTSDTPANTSSSEALPTEPNGNAPESFPPETSLENSPDTDAVVTNSGELPTSVKTSVLQDIASNSNVPIEEMEVETAVPQSWPDGCLGLGGPDDICTFALVEGWEVTVSQGDNIWVYRTDSDGFVVKEDTSGT